MATNEPVPPSGNGFDEWQSIDERNGSDKSSNSGSQNSSSWYLVQVSFVFLACVILSILVREFIKIIVNCVKL
jgi:flagellar biosynthesis/type III secretory pathway M-ring protein FliF/YscJ